MEILNHRSENDREEILKLIVIIIFDQLHFHYIAFKNISIILYAAIQIKIILDHNLY